MHATSQQLSRLILAGFLPMWAGCASVPIPIHTSHAQSVSVAVHSPARPTPVPKSTALAPPILPVSATELTLNGLDELLAQARTRNPELSAAAARVGEVHGRMLQAGLYPNPTVGYSGNQINDGPGTAGQQGGFVSQEIVTAGKLKIAREAARFGVTAADWQAVSRWFDTAAKVKAAYYEYATALAVLRETERTANLFSEGLAKTEKLAAAGKVEAYDVTRLKVEVAQTANRVGAARQRVAAAERMLAVAVGVDRLPNLIAAELSPDATVPGYDESMALLDRSSVVLAAVAEAEQARVEVRAAETKPIPNVQTMTTIAHDYTTRAPMASVQIGLPLPLWDRNPGSIMAAKYRLRAATAGIEQARLRAIERLAGAYQRYENARRQLELYQTKVLPDAAAALEQIDRVYAARGERFLDTLDARRALAQARIDYAQFLGDLWAAVAEIEAVAQFQR
jgi:cobalt-zinc-cadmium efflux system outer membrane protein